ncbi:helix-turn-helix domain-containing protein [Taklimakanibacter deserti]|uniref:helix-turn-helix domain-containing protein n=1 Tax=Taklimakanibacter deserti TaxID=2267839 RepID=UPI000E654181
MAKKLKLYDSVWDAIEDDPVEAARMKLRSDLMISLEQKITRSGWTQKETAKRLGISQPRVSDLLRGKINLFSVDNLIDLLAKAGMQVDVKVRARGKAREKQAA